MISQEQHQHSLYHNHNHNHHQQQQKQQQQQQQQYDRQPTSTKWTLFSLFVVQFLFVTMSVSFVSSVRDDYVQHHNDKNAGSSNSTTSNTIQQQQQSLLFERKITASTSTISTSTNIIGDYRTRLAGTNGDEFDNFNEQFKNVIIVLPDSDAVKQSNIEVRLTTLRCTHLMIGDVTTSWQIYSSTMDDDNNNTGATSTSGTAGEVTTGFLETLGYNIVVSPFDIDCTSDYNYKFGSFLKGSGVMNAISTNSIANIRININSMNGFEKEVPINVNIPRCELLLNIDKIIFDGGIDAEILNLAENIIKDIVQSQVKKLLCDWLTTKGSTAIMKYFNQTSIQINPRTGPVPDELANPLYVEQSFLATQEMNHSVEWINFNTVNGTDKSSNKTSTVDALVVSGMKLIQKFLGGTSNSNNNNNNNNSNDRSSSGGRSSKELTINGILQKLLPIDSSGKADGSVLEWNLLPDSSPNATTTLNGTTSNSSSKSTSTSNNLFATLPILVNVTEPVPMIVLLKKVRLYGVNTIIVFDPLIPIGNYTLQNEIKWDHLSIEMDVEIRIQPSTLSDDDTVLYSIEPIEIIEDGTVSMNITNVTIAMSLFVAIDKVKLEMIPLGSLLHMDTFLQCLLQPILHTVQVSGLVVLFDTYTPPSLHYFPTPGIERVAESFLDAAFVSVVPAIVAALPNIFQGPIRDIVNKQLLLLNVLDNNKTNVTTTIKCPNNYSITGNSNSIENEELKNEVMIDFRNLFLSDADSVALGESGDSTYGNLIRYGYNFVQDELFQIDPETGLATVINPQLSKLVGTDDGTILFPGDLFQQELNVNAGGLQAYVQLRAYDAYIRHIDSIGAPLSLLEPTSSYPDVLNNSATVGVYRPLTVGMNMLLALSSDDTKIRNDVEISIGVHDMRVLVTLLMQVSEKAVLGFPIKDFASLNCWLATIPSPILDKHGVRIRKGDESLKIMDFIGLVDNFDLNVTCKDCSGSQFPELTLLLQSDTNSEAVTDIARALFGMVTKMIKGEFLQVQMDRALHNAPKQCPHHSEYESNFVPPVYVAAESNEKTESGSFFIALIIVTVALIGIVIATRMIVKVIVQRRHTQWLDTLTQPQLQILSHYQTQKKEREVQLNLSTTSMFQSMSIPSWIRMSMPLIILGNIGFFLSGHLSLGASVTILITLGGDILRADNFFSFSMAKSTIEIWNAGGKALAIIIFFASFAWPYTKQLITLVLWFLPPRAVTVSTRGSIFLWLDALAKWSMIDIFVLVVTLVCMRVSIKSPGVTYLPAGFYQIDLLVVPKWGLYANMIAQLISQVSSHYIIHYHRRIVEDALAAEQPKSNHPRFAKTQDDADVGTKQNQLPANKLCRHAFRRAHRGESDRLVARPFLVYAIPIFGVVVSFLFVIGCVLPLFSIDILGIIGVLVESGQAFDDAYTRYSLFTVVKVLFDQAKLTGQIGDYLGLGTLSLLAVFTVLIVPIAQVGTLLTQWFLPFDQIQRNRLNVLLEVLQAWQYAEVYLLSILIASWQLGPLSEFMVNPYCTGLNGLFSQLISFGIWKEEDSQCLKIDVTVEGTFYILFTAAIVLAIFNTFVSRATYQYFSDIETTTMIVAMQKASTVEPIDSDTYNNNAKATISSPGIMFTDIFRWLLCREDQLFRISMTRRCSDGIHRHSIDDRIVPDGGSMEEIDLDETTQETYPEIEIGNGQAVL